VFAKTRGEATVTYSLDPSVAAGGVPGSPGEAQALLGLARVQDRLLVEFEGRPQADIVVCDEFAASVGMMTLPSGTVHLIHPRRG
jgi:hypothetical protein